jgi:hypothetical protein
MEAINRAGEMDFRWWLGNQSVKHILGYDVDPNESLSNCSRCV